MNRAIVALPRVPVRYKNGNGMQTEKRVFYVSIGSPSLFNTMLSAKATETSFVLWHYFSVRIATICSQMCINSI
jgi:N-acetylneuraminic acid mutarotase